MKAIPTMSQSELEATVRRLMDIECIKAMKAEYGRLVDACAENPNPASLDELTALFTADAVADFGERLGLQEGIGAIRALFGERLPGGNLWMWHSFHSAQIDIDGDSAVARWTLYALAERRATPGQSDAVYGRYEDRYVRVDGRWKQTHLKFIDETRKG